MPKVKHYRGGKRKAVRVEDKPARTQPQRRQATQRQSTSPAKPVAALAENEEDTQ